MVIVFVIMNSIREDIDIKLVLIIWRKSAKLRLHSDKEIKKKHVSYK